MLGKQPHKISKAVRRLFRARRFQDAIWQLQKVKHPRHAAVRRWAERFLATARPAEVVHYEEELGFDSDRPVYIVRFKNGMRGVFRTEHQHERYPWEGELGAYRIDRILGSGMVPVTVERTLRVPGVGRVKGSLQLLVEGGRDVICFDDDPTKIPGWKKNPVQYTPEQGAFRHLVFEADPSGNEMVSPRGWRFMADFEAALHYGSIQAAKQGRAVVGFPTDPSKVKVTPAFNKKLRSAPARAFYGDPVLRKLFDKEVIDEVVRRKGELEQQFRKQER